MFPCSFVGTYTAFLSWTFLDIPLDLTRVTSLEQVSDVLRPQLRDVCAANGNGMADECLAELEWQLEAWIRWQCAEKPTPLARSKGQSHARFRGEVASSLVLDSSGWSLSEVDRAYSLDTNELARAALSFTGYDGGLCSGIVSSDPLTSQQHVLVMGLSGGQATNPATRYRDYVLRDLLGCLPMTAAAVRLCVDPFDWETSADAEADCSEMVAFASSPPARLSCGPCAPPAPQETRDARVILVSVARGSHASGITPLVQEAKALKKMWGEASLAALVHVHDETPPPPFTPPGRLNQAADDADPSWVKSLRELYTGWPLVLRTYPLPGTPLVRNQSSQSSSVLDGNVVR